MTTKVLPFTESTLVTFKNKLHHLKESFRSISHQSCVTGTLLLRKKNYPRRYSLNLRQLIIFMFLHGWFFISYQTQIFACDPSRINWTATGAFPGGFADDDDEYSAEGVFPVMGSDLWNGFLSSLTAMLSGSRGTGGSILSFRQLENIVTHPAKTAQATVIRFIIIMSV